MASSLSVVPDCCSPCDGLVYTVDTSGSVTSAVGVFVVALVGNLRALLPLATNLVAFLVDLDVVGDGQGGQYRWVALSTAADDGISIIKPDALGVLDPGRWLKMI